MKNVMITGGAGFIGSNFVRTILESKLADEVVVLDKLTYAGNIMNLTDVAGIPDCRFVKGDICDRPLVEKLLVEEDIDTIVHFAAESHVDRSISGPSEFIQTNIVGTFTLLDAARVYWQDRSDVRFLHVSTDEVYGSLGDTGLFTENTPYDPRSPYSASKASSDHIVSSYFHTYGFPALITNCSNNYGPYHFPEKLIPLIINNALNGKKLPVYGDGTNVRDWLYVVDHCQAILTVLKKGKLGETYNVGGNNEKQNIEVVQTICDILDMKTALLPTGEPRRSLITFVKDRPGHDRRYAIDASKISEELGWEPSVTFEEGIERTVEWYLDNPEWIEDVTSGSYREYYDQMYEGREV